MAKLFNADLITNREEGEMTKTLFTKKETMTVWQSYTQQLEIILKKVKTSYRKDIITEIQSHILDGFSELKLKNETERLKKAIKNLGDPSDFLMPLIAEKYLNDASSNYKPMFIAKGLYYYIKSGFRQSLKAMIYITGYILVGGFALVAVLKIFQPKRVGFFLSEAGSINIGFVEKTVMVNRELLGFWIIPLALIMSLTLYYALSKLLKLLKSRRD
jgi:uncharacterized membrane protein